MQNNFAKFRRLVSVLAYLHILAFLGGCVTPMGQADIESLTTCTGADLTTIRKNLMLAGYVIKAQGASDLSTEFRQVGGYGYDRSLRRINVVEVKPGTYRFRVTNQVISIDRDRHNFGGGTSMGKEKSPTVVIDLSQPVETTNEYDETYYVERRDDYESVRREVCGK